MDFIEGEKDQRQKCDTAKQVNCEKYLQASHYGLLMLLFSCCSALRCVQNPFSWLLYKRDLRRKLKWEKTEKCAIPIRCKNERSKGKRTKSYLKGYIGCKIS
ncbi:EC1118_1P2_4159p [Saccharomyces cerevisiae EC1118]|uniref:Putative uncharacterized protein YPR092W n=2 Tax=Saccharomyces cerevisiae TaxID=4932 RepID=YP092_YEAST|nr:RecName: Full=Putative uncharacterized protein YPR092W [Saccharomyces cerevisiae S288C]AAB68147.1 Ypr092wp [Saccharomyces cerevisiae]CAY87046.1 EC1118_1P2_4159p [Saccharomyces cerevisiae EC1118]